MPTIQHVLMINRPIADVFAGIAAFDRIPEWIPSVRRAYVSSPGSTGVGTTFVEETSMFGRPIQIIGTVTAYEPDHKLVYVYNDKPLPGIWQYRLTPDGNGTRLDFHLEITHQKGILSARNPLILALFRRMIVANLASFKTWVEAYASEAASTHTMGSTGV